MEYFVGDYAEFSSIETANVNNNVNNNGVHFTVDDLLDFSKEDETMTDVFFGGNSGDSSTVTVIDSCNSSVSGGDGQFNGNVSCRSFTESQFCSNELCVPYDDVAELEWLSNFVEESFSTEDLDFIPTAAVAAKSTAATVTDTSSSVTTTLPPPVFPTDVSVPGKARSKRSRAAPGDWSSRLLLLSPFSNLKTTPSVKIETPGRKCLHCASEKTPQWRTGPMGPKTLCNACGVRYKSGRFVPEYRPAASPTFVMSKHSNSHRKVMELRRQKELQLQQHQHQHQHRQNLINQVSIFNASNGCDEFFIHRRCSMDDPNFRHMI